MKKWILGIGLILSQALSATVLTQESVVNAGELVTDLEDMTSAFQQALDSGASKVWVPKLEVPWILGPVELRSNQVIEFEEGVEIVALKGAFVPRYSCLFAGRAISDLTIKGNGLVVRMNKEEYVQEDHPVSEWRHGIAFFSAKNVLVEDVTVMNSGGDGFYMGNANRLLPRGQQDREKEYAQYPQYNDNITLRRVKSIGNHRQGLSITTGQNILVEESLFADTIGTNPQAGIDVEPNRPYERIQNIVFRDVISRNNYGSGFEVHVGKFRNSGNEISITYENCRVEGGRGSAFSVHGPGGEDPIKGEIRLVDFYAENTGGPALNVRHIPADGFKIHFERAEFVNVASREDFVPFWIQVRGSETLDQGNIWFEDCVLRDHQRRPIARFLRQGEATVAVRELQGNLRVLSPYRPDLLVDNGLKTDLNWKFDWKRVRK